MHRRHRLHRALHPHHYASPQPHTRQPRHLRPAFFPTATPSTPPTLPPSISHIFPPPPASPTFSPHSPLVPSSPLDSYATTVAPPPSTHTLSTSLSMAQPSSPEHVHPPPTSGPSISLASAHKNHPSSYPTINHLTASTPSSPATPPSPDELLSTMPPFSLPPSPLGAPPSTEATSRPGPTSQPSKSDATHQPPSP